MAIYTRKCYSDYWSGGKIALKTLSDNRSTTSRSIKAEKWIKWYLLITRKCTKWCYTAVIQQSIYLDVNHLFTFRYATILWTPHVPKKAQTKLAEPSRRFPQDFQSLSPSRITSTIRASDSFLSQKTVSETEHFPKYRRRQKFHRSTHRKIGGCASCWNVCYLAAAIWIIQPSSPLSVLNRSPTDSRHSAATLRCHPLAINATFPHTLRTLPRIYHLRLTPRNVEGNTNTVDQPDA